MKFFKPGSVIRDSTEFVDDNFTGTMNLSIKLETEITDFNGEANLLACNNCVEKDV